MVKITISGHPGSGTSTLVKGICNHFSWNFLNGGQIFRDEAERREMTLSEFGDLCANDFSVDKYLDDILKENMLKNDGPEVIESRLSGWWAYKLNLDCVRLWVEVSEKVRAERVVEREGISLETALSQNSKRSQKDSARYLEMYGLSPADREPYSHVIDASEIDADEVLVKVIKILEDLL